MTKTHETGHKSVIGRIGTSFRRWWAKQRLCTELASLTDEELNHLLADVGLGRADLFSGRLSPPTTP